jgi:hypothetical protein
MRSRHERIARKAELLASLDPRREVNLQGTYDNHVVAAIRASSPTDRQREIDKATEAYENALDHALYEVLDKRAEGTVSDVGFHDSG